MVKIFIKDGWQLNPNENVVNAILKRCELNNGLCPCAHKDNDWDLHCPCESYRLRNKCVCGLYKKLEYA